ncbi:MAG: DUF2237 domain-containing protein [Pseudomonadota bacterium]
MNDSTVARNVLGDPLAPCCDITRTGYWRDGFCRTGPQDVGRHVVCAVVTDAFLEFSRSRGNDLVTPMPQFDFPGLSAGDRWCLCAGRWLEAYQAGCAPPVDLEATEKSALEMVPLKALQAHAIAPDTD